MTIPEQKVAVLTKYSIRGGKEDQFEESLMEMIKPVRDRDECIAYEIYRAKSDKTSFHTLEKWETIGKLNRDKEIDHLNKFKEKNKNLMEDDPEIILLDLVV